MLRLSTFNPAIIDIYCCHSHENVDGKQQIFTSDNELIIVTKSLDVTINVDRNFILDVMTGLLAVHSMGYVLPSNTWNCASSNGKGILTNLQDAVQISSNCYLAQNNTANPDAIKFDIVTLLEKLKAFNDEVLELLATISTDAELYSLILEYRNTPLKQSMENLRIVPTITPGKLITVEHRDVAKHILLGCQEKEPEIVFAMSIDILYRCPEEFLALETRNDLLSAIYFLAKNWYHQPVTTTSTFWMKIIAKLDGLLYRPYLWEHYAVFSPEERHDALVRIFNKIYDYPSIDVTTLRKNRSFVIPPSTCL